MSFETATHPSPGVVETLTVGVVTGTGNPSLAPLREARREHSANRFGDCELHRGTIGDRTIVHVSRHGEGHLRVSNHVNHRANVKALAEAGVDAVIGVTVCGAVDPTVAPGSLVAFDDLHFLVNRLPDGSLCTFHDEPGAAGRGHWVLGEPFSEPLRRALVDGAGAAGREIVDGGVYGHVDGPRFNTRAEVRTLAVAGVTAISQTAGPEAVLCGELEIPYALLGYVTDYANGVKPDDPTPLEELLRLIGDSGEAFGAVISAALPLIDPAGLEPAGTMYRFGEESR
jgi:purine nucleoside phosphorylase